MRHRPLPSRLPSGSDRRRRVAVLVDTSTSWGRGVIQGVHQYALGRQWQLFLEPLGVEQAVSLAGKWSGDGVIARVGYRELAADLRRLRIPAVNVSGILLPRLTFPRVTVDHTASARLAADYFLGRGYRHFAYFGIRNLGYVARHQEAFTRILKQEGRACALFSADAWQGAEPDWLLDVAALGRWLAGLPRPLAVLTWNAGGAREVLYACQAAGLRVPEEVAVLAGSDDELLCELSPVPLSGIRQPAEQLGARAASLLDSMMQGLGAPPPLTELRPERIVTRRSTESFAVSDPAVVRALHYIREHADTPLQVQDVARAAAVSRRILERHFHQVLQRSPGEEIRRAHLDLAMRLLRETPLSIPDVAQAAGFSSPEYFASVFKRATGKSPLEFRKELPGAGIRG